MKDKSDIVKAWIRKAENDLINATNSINIKPKPPLDTVCFHAQQCTEKYLKAYLVQCGINFEKIHDLGELVLLAIKNLCYQNYLRRGREKCLRSS